MINGFRQIHGCSLPICRQHTGNRGEYNLWLVRLWPIVFFLIAIVPHALAPTAGLHTEHLTVLLLILCFDDDCSSPHL